MDRFGILGYTVRSNASLFAQMEKHKHGSLSASRFGCNGFFVEVAKFIWNSSDSDKERPDYEAFRYNAIRRLPLRFPMDGFWLVIRPGVKNESDNESDGDKTLVDEDEQSLYIQDEEGEDYGDQWALFHDQLLQIWQPIYEKDWKKLDRELGTTWRMIRDDSSFDWTAYFYLQ